MKPPFKWAVVPLAVCLAAVAVFAEEEQDLFSMSLDDLLKIKVVGSTLTEQGLNRVPAAVTVFSHEQIRRLGIDYVDELMNLVPGFQRYRSASSGMSYAYSARGRRNSDVSNEILILIDGLPWLSPRLGGGAVNFPLIPAANVERVEFIRGPGSAIYGTNAMMGVVNIVSRRDSNALHLAAGNWDRRVGELQWAASQGELAMQLHARTESDQGDHYVVKETFTANRSETRDPRTLEDIYLQLFWRDTSAQWRHSERKVEDFFVLSTNADGLEQQRTQLGQFALSQQLTLGPLQSQLTISFTEDRDEISGQLLAAGALAAASNPPSSEPLLARAELASQQWQLSWQNDWPQISGSIQFGLEARRVETTRAILYNNFDVGDLANRRFPVRYYGDLLPTTPLENLAHRDNIGLYSQYLWPPTVVTELTLGLRWDDYRDIGSHLSPRFGLSHQLNDIHIVKILYGEAFRAPTVAETDLINNPIILGNPELQPETVSTTELIWMAQWPETAVSLGYFANRFEDSIVAQPQGRLLQYTNTTQGPSKGLELEISQQWGEHWISRLSAMYLTEKPDSSFREADELVSLTLNYQRSRWNASLMVIRHGERQMATGGSVNNRLTLDAYWETNAKLTVAVAADIEGFLQVKNLADETFGSPPLSAVLTEGIPSRGQEWLLGLNWRF